MTIPERNPLSMKGLCMLILIAPCLNLLAINPTEPDGPYVFYKDNQRFVKYVENDKLNTYIYPLNAKPRLSCTVPNSKEKFYFYLQDSIKNEPDYYSSTNKIIALSDIEGNFDGLKTILLGAKIINSQFLWIFGKGHLVLVGDFMDRGAYVNECLWLIYKLETEAANAGGKVHFILGNHEILNLQGVTEYVNLKYLSNSLILNEEYKNCYGINSELGRWLRSKNAIEKIGNVLYCHGGVSRELLDANLPIREINNISRNYLGKPLKSIPPGNPQIVFNQQNGIFWSRALAKNLLTPDEVTQIMITYEAESMVIGHTLFHEITANYGGKIICIDLYHADNLRRGFMKCLQINQGAFATLNHKNETSPILSVN